MFIALIILNAFEIMVWKMNKLETLINNNKFNLDIYIQLILIEIFQRRMEKILHYTRSQELFLQKK